MIQFFRDKVDRVFGYGRHSTAVPVLDGPMQPNHGLDEADVLCKADDLDNLVETESGIHFSSGHSMMMVEKSGQLTEVEMFEAPITCLASTSNSTIAIGIEGVGIVLRGGDYDRQSIDNLDGQPLRCATAMFFIDPNTLLITVGSKSNSAAQWKRDLMTLERSGSVWRFDLSQGEAKCLTSGLGFPYGIIAQEDGTVVVSESWLHRLISIDENTSTTKVLLDDIAGYPSRIIPAKEGGYWLTVFAPRNQLVEFVLREKSFRRDMTAEVDPKYWIAPSLVSKVSYKEALQGGAVKQMGILKPWAPAFSYGLIAKLDANFSLRASWHSRADGCRHGVTSACESDGRLIVGSKGAGLGLTFDSKALSTDNF